MADGMAGPTTPREWAEVEDYVGPFEHWEIMLRNGLIDVETFEAIFGYPISNLLNNRQIVRQTLIARRDQCPVFLRLRERLKMQVLNVTTALTSAVASLGQATVASRRLNRSNWQRGGCHHLLVTKTCRRGNACMSVSTASNLHEYPSFRDASAMSRRIPPSW